MYNVIGFVIYKQNCLRTFLFKCSYIEVIFIRRHNNTMKSIREKLNFDPEFQNFILQKPTLSQESLNAYTMTLVNFIKFTDEPFYKTVQELRTLQNDRIENNMIIRFNPNQSESTHCIMSSLNF